jgi:uncharacterized membrane protein HdeD (DUF308 family)
MATTKEGPMEAEVIVFRHWWAYLLRGLIAIALGVVLIVYPSATLKTFIYIFAAFALLGGIIDLIAAIVLAFRKESWGWPLAGGLLSILLGGILLSHPEVALGVVVILVAIWALITGIAMLASAFDMPPHTGRGWIGVGGALAIIAGIVILAYPAGSTYAVMVLVAIYAFIGGAFSIVLGFWALSQGRKMTPAT